MKQALVGFVLVLQGVAISHGAPAQSDDARVDRQASPPGRRAEDAGPRRKLVDPKGTTATRALQRRLHEPADRGALFGQQDATAYGVGWSAEPGRCDVKDVWGAYPAVYGWDVGDIHRDRNLDRVSFRRMKSWIREAGARGGINTISMHLDNPVPAGAKRIVLVAHPTEDGNRANLADWVDVGFVVAKP